MVKMTGYICTTCGVQYAPTRKHPLQCPVCEDERQFVNPNGQNWTSMEQLSEGHRNEIMQVAESVYSIHTQPGFAISQTAYLITSPAGNILWDCVTHLDDATMNAIGKLGGLRGIAISHPHFYSTISRWSQAFGNVPVYLHVKDKAWMFDNFDHIVFWNSPRLLLWDHISLIHCGGHFPGSSVLHYPGGRALFTGDTIQVCADQKSISCMYSYPNLIPLSKQEIVYIKQAVANADYEVIYGAFGKKITVNAKEAVNFSLNRYLTIYE